ncbi:MAG: ATP-binding protein [Alphaproteobacteria bacterium]
MPEIYDETQQTTVSFSGPNADETLIDALLEALPEPVVLLSIESQVLRFNSQAKAFFPSLRRHQHISSVIRDPGVLQGLTVAAREDCQFSHTVAYYERVPIERHMAATIARIAETNAAIAAHGSGQNQPSAPNPAILLHMRDLTELERLNRLRSDFIANASHELRTPLTAVMGFIETLQGPARNDAAAQERFLEIMARQAQRMTRLIDDLLSLSRIELRQHLPPKAAVDLNDIVQQVLNMLEPAAKKSETVLHFEPLDEPAIVLGDRDELVQVFTNLVENAIKYGKEGGNIWLNAASVQIGQIQHYMVTVRDEGPGISESHLPRLTERFYRVNDEKSGTGLGLAIVKHTLNRHRGTLKIVSELGEGASFIVTIPSTDVEISI